MALFGLLLVTEELVDGVVLHRIDPGVELLLIVRAADVFGDARAVLLRHPFDERFVDGKLLPLVFLRSPKGVDELMLPRAQLPDRRVRNVERVDHRLFRDFVRLSFHHHEGVFFPRDEEVHVAFLGLVDRRVDDELPVDAGDAYFGDRSAERSARQHQRSRGPDAGQDVGVVLLSGTDDEVDEMRVVEESIRKERTDGAVDQAGCQRLFVGRPPLSFDEASRYLSAGGEFLTVVDRQREEVIAFLGAVGQRGRRQHHRVAQADDDRAVGLLGNPARFNRQGFTRREFDFAYSCVGLHVSQSHSLNQWRKAIRPKRPEARSSVGVGQRTKSTSRAGRTTGRVGTIAHRVRSLRSRRTAAAPEGSAQCAWVRGVAALSLPVMGRTSTRRVLAVPPLRTPHSRGRKRGPKTTNSKRPPQRGRR